MFDFHEKRKIRALVYSKLSIGIILVLTGLLLVSVYERFTVERETAYRKELQAAELRALKERAASLEVKVEHLENERGIEEELRSRFDVAKEGEQVIIILDDRAAGEQDATNIIQKEQNIPEERSWFEVLKFW